MKRTIMATLLLLAVALSAGCSKDKEKTDLRNQVATLQEQVGKLETQNKELKGQQDQLNLKLIDQKRQDEDLQRALETRLLHHPLSEFTVEPSASIENGWLMVDGEHTYTLSGYAGANKVVFFWAESGTSFRPQELGADENGKDGWSWTGVIPSGNIRAFWAEISYPGGVRVQSGVLPLRSSGK